MARLTEWRPDQLVFLDESATNEHTMDRKYGWAPIGVDSIISRSQKRRERHSILPTYSLDGVIAFEIFQSFYTKALYCWFIKQYVLPQCNAFPGPRSVLIIDNASAHRSQVSLQHSFLRFVLTNVFQRLVDLCAERGIILAYLPPYSPDYNPIEELFSIIKHWMKRNTLLAQHYPDYKSFLEAIVSENLNRTHARKHFISAGIGVTE